MCVLAKPVNWLAKTIERPACVPQVLLLIADIRLRPPTTLALLGGGKGRACRLKRVASLRAG